MSTQQKKKVVDFFNLNSNYIKGDQTTINSEKLKEIVNVNYKDIFVLYELFYFIIGIIFYKTKEMDFLWFDRRVKDIFRNLKLIGEGVEGSVYSVSFGNNENLFVLKQGEDIYHEILVGIFALNHLRFKCPNFYFIMGGFETTEALDENVGFGTGIGSRGSYIISEYIYPSQTLNDAIETISMKEFIGVVFQIFNALEIAHQVCDFTHYDLHIVNILLRKTEKYNLPLYAIDNSIEIKRIATIVDYGFSHIKLDGKSYGSVSSAEIGVSSKRSYPFHDALKFLSDTYHASNRIKRHDIAKLCKTIISEVLLINEPVDYILKKLQRNYNCIRYFKRYSKYRHSVMLKYLAENYSPYLSNEIVKYPDIKGFFFKHDSDDLNIVNPKMYYPTNYTELNDQIFMRRVPLTKIEADLPKIKANVLKDLRKATTIAKAKKDKLLRRCHAREIEFNIGLYKEIGEKLNKTFNITGMDEGFYLDETLEKELNSKITTEKEIENFNIFAQFLK